MLRWARWSAPALAVAGLGLAGCNPNAGEAAIVVTGDEQGVVTGPTVTCQPPGHGGETVTPSWEWSGTIDGEAATLMFAGLWQPGKVDAGSLIVGGRQYAALDQPNGQLVRQTGSIDANGTLHVAATLPRVFGGETGTVEIRADLRCPTWPVE